MAWSSLLSRGGPRISWTEKAETVRAGSARWRRENRLLERAEDLVPLGDQRLADPSRHCRSASIVARIPAMRSGSWCAPQATGPAAGSRRSAHDAVGDVRREPRLEQAQVLEAHRVVEALEQPLAAAEHDRRDRDPQLLHVASAP